MKSAIKKIIIFIVLTLTINVACLSACTKANRLKSQEDYFSIMTSNSLSSSANQTFFYTVDENEEYTGRVFYKISNGGKYNYSFLFSSTLDSSYPRENWTKCNTEVLDWEIVEAKVGVADEADMLRMTEVSNFEQLYFDGEKNKVIDEAGFFYTDELELNVNAGEYLCLEIAYKGKKIPHHDSNEIPSFKWTRGQWVASNQAVFAQVIGCDREVEKRVAFLGDSITQGTGEGVDCYNHWASLLSQRLSKEHSYWNLGIGNAMANDCATDKSWLAKAKQNDVVFLCLGVNDVSTITNEETTKADLSKIVDLLNEAGCKVILQTLPPFNFSGNKLNIWNNLNTYIKEDLAQSVYAVFDVSPLLTEGAVEEGVAKYGAHPNAEGCQVWADALFAFINTNQLV